MSQEGPHASPSNRRCPPPRPSRPKRLSHPGQLWQALPAESREPILNALCRVVAEHLTMPLAAREVTHEQP
jgi:hypothetical protein